MNKKNSSQYVLICFVAGVFICIAVIYLLIAPALTSFQEGSRGQTNSESELKKITEKVEKEKRRLEEEEINLRSIKQIYETNVDGDASNLSSFGTMFDDVIKIAQQNSLFIRSIEYDTTPDENSVYANFNDQYNVCKLKFFFVGKYSNLRTFLNDITNNFKYLISISDLNVTVFSSDTDYILIRISLSLYSKKPFK